MAGLLLGIVLLPLPQVMEHSGAVPGLALQYAACALVGALTGWLVFRTLACGSMPVALIGLLIIGWLFTPTPLLWSLLVAALLLWPVFVSLLPASRIAE